MSIKALITFGQAHAHSIGGQTFDKDCVAVVQGATLEEAETKAFRYFGSKFCNIYEESEFPSGSLKYYPRGLITVK